MKLTWSYRESEKHAHVGSKGVWRFTFSCVMRVTPSATGPFISWRLPFGELGVCFLTPCEIILALRVHPERLSWHFEIILEEYGSSRVDTRWPGTWFSLILDWSGDSSLKVFLAPRLEIPILFGFVSRSLFYRCLCRNLMLGAFNSRFSHGRYGENMFYRRSRGIQSAIRISINRFGSDLTLASKWN